MTDERPMSTPPAPDAAAPDLEPLRAIATLPLGEHLGRYEQVHATLREALSQIDR